MKDGFFSVGEMTPLSLVSFGFFSLGRIKSSTTYLHVFDFSRTVTKNTRIYIEKCVRVSKCVGDFFPHTPILN